MSKLDLTWKAPGVAAALTCAVVLLPGCNNEEQQSAAVVQSKTRTVNQDGGGAPASSMGGRSKASSAPFDVGRVIRQVHFSFKPCQGHSCVFEAGHTTHSVRVDRDLRLTLTPAHHQPQPVTAAGPAMHRPPQRPEGQHKRPAPRVGRPLTIHTESVHRGTTALGGGGAARVAADGSLRITRAHLEERLVNSGAGVEQSWAFARRPAGSGDVVVKVRISGLRFRGISHAGLHFTDPASGLGVRYGWATFVDAAGRRTEVKGQLRNGKIVMRVPAAVIDGASYPAVLDPIISPEIGINKPASGPAWNTQTRPRVAHDGTNYLVVWQDRRDTVTNNYDIYGARVSTSGTVLDTSGILISRAVNSQQAPSVAFGSGTYMVVWYDLRNHSSYADIYGARIKPDGTVLDQGGIPISVATYYQYTPFVTFGGGTFLVVWYDYRHSSYDIYAARVKPDGTVQDPSGIAISKAGNHQYTPTAAYDGTNFFVVWYDHRYHGSYPDIFGARVSTAGKVLDTSGIRITSASYYQYNPHVAYIYNGSTYLVVWRDHRNGRTYGDIYGARVSTAGKVLDPNGIAISKAGNHQYSPAVAHDGSGFQVVWQDYRSGKNWDIYGARVSTSGTVLDTSGKLISASSGHKQSPFLAYGGKDYFIVWQDDRNGTNLSSDIYGARMSGGTVTTPSGILVSTAAPAQHKPAVAHDGTNYLVVWQDYRNYKSLGQDIHGALVGPTGTVLNSAGIAISSFAKDQTSPAVAFGASRYLVVWQDSRSGTHIYGAQVDTSGKVLQPTGFPLSVAANSQVAPDVAYDGTANYLVVWQDYRNSTSYPDIYGALVNQYGGKTSSVDIAIGKATNHQQAPAVAYGGGSFLVAWEDNRNSSSTTWDIYASRIKPDGTVADPKGIAVSTEYLDQRTPDVASDGIGYLVVWKDARHSYASGYDIYGARLNALGVVGDKAGIPVAVAGALQDLPQVAFGGTDYLVVWQDFRHGTYDSNVLGTLLTTGGKVVSPLGLGIATSSLPELAPGVAAGSKGSYLVSYARLDTQSPAGSFRVKGRLVTEEQENGASCAGGKQCKSGFCADGVCCDKACGQGNPTDCQACSVATGASKDGTCEPAKAGTSCRAASGICDKAEVCDGSNGSCPTDQFQPSSQICRGALGPCDVAESCSGSSADCPTDSFTASGTVCRATAGPCDLAEICSGTSAACPTDTFMPAAKECRASAGVCDVPENCSGSSALCPTDQFKPATAACRTATSDCDQEEKCTGASATCPADLFKIDGTACKTGKCKAGQCLTLPDQGAVDKGVPEASVDKGVDQGADQALPDQGPPKPDLAVPDKGPTPDQQCPAPECAECEEGCQMGGGSAGHGLAGLLLLCALAWWRRRR